jgi:hypothetical protein
MTLPDVTPSVCRWMSAKGVCVSPDIGSKIEHYLFLSLEARQISGACVCLAALTYNTEIKRALAQTGQLEPAPGILKRPCMGYLALEDGKK